MFHVEQGRERQLVEGGGTLRAQHLPWGKMLLKVVAVVWSRGTDSFRTWT